MTIKTLRNFFLSFGELVRQEELLLLFFRMNHHKSQDYISRKQFLREFKPRVQLMGVIDEKEIQKKQKK